MKANNRKKKTMKFAIFFWVLMFIVSVSCTKNNSNTSLESHKNAIQDMKRTSETEYAKLNSVIPKKFRSFGIRRGGIDVTRGKECATENTSQQKKLTVKDVAKILLLNNARDASNVLKENPINRNDKLIKLLHENANDDLLADILFTDVDSIKDTFTKPDIDLKIRILLETDNSVDSKLNELSLYLTDFLSLQNDDRYHEEFYSETESIERKIKRLLYLNPDGIKDAVDLYNVEMEKNNLSGNTNNDDDLNNEELFKCLPADRNKTTLTVKTNDLVNSSKEDESLLEFDKSIPHVQTQDREITDTEIKVNDIEEIPAKELQFLDIPDGDDMRIHSLKMEDENLIFATFSMIVSYLQPDEFPLGLLRDAFRKHVSLHILVLQILKLEGLVLCWVLFWAILSLCLPCAVVAQMCCPRRNMQRLRDDTSSASSNLNNKCTGKTAGSVLYILMLSLLCIILLMFFANDKFSRGIERSPKTAAIIFKDLETFIKNTHSQMSFVATSSFEITMDQINGDLHDAEKLLGNSFKKDFVMETEFDKTIEALIDLKSGSTEISKRVRELLRECNVAKGAGKLLQESLSELSKQLNLARRYCTQKDRSLCESLQSTGLDLAFSVEELLAEPNLQYLERITHDNKFNASIDETVKLLNAIPKHIEVETSSHRAGIQDILQQRRRQMYNSVRSLKDISKSMTISVRTAAEDILHLMESVTSRDLWRYLVVFATGFLTFLAWILFVCGSPCCCHYTKKTIPYLKMGISLACGLSIILWICGSFEFLIGGHGQAIICNPLYEDHFVILSNVLDKDGLTYKEGYFTHILKVNESLRTDEILRNCQHNQPSYTTFHLQNRLDISKTFSYQTWKDLKERFDDFSFNTKDLRIFSPNLERNLEGYSTAAANNKFRDIRSKISLPVTHNDLNTFYNQIYSVTKQISNTKSATSLERVMVKTQDIVSNQLKVVQNHRDSILYKLTALEILLQPINIKVQSYLNNLVEAQIFLEDNGELLAEKNIRNYIFRIERYLHDLQKYTSEQIRRKIGKCKPIWDLFFHARHHVCKTIIDPLNALCFFHFIAILIFLCMTPIIIGLIAYYKDFDGHLESFSDGRFDEELHMRDQAIWTTPHSGTSSNGNNLDISPLNEETRWTIPRPPEPPSDALIPSLPRFPLEQPTVPPRPPSISSTRTAPKLAGLYTIAKAKSIRSKYDPLKFIERTWKTPRSVQSPRGWL